MKRSGGTIPKPSGHSARLFLLAIAMVIAMVVIASSRFALNIPTTSDDSNSPPPVRLCNSNNAASQQHKALSSLGHRSNTLPDTTTSSDASDERPSLPNLDVFDGSSLSSGYCKMTTCFKQECMEENGECVPNRYHHPVANPVDPTETLCRPSEADGEEGSPTESSNSKNTNENSAITAFKSLTKWFFRKWQDWPGECDEPIGDGQTRTYHDPETMLYTMENICIRPAHGFGGVNPRVEPYDGQHDVWWYQRRFGTWDQQNQIKGVLNASRFFNLTKPAQCYLNTPLLILPLGWRMNVAAHTIQWFGSLLRMLQAAFGYTRASDKPYDPISGIAPRLRKLNATVAMMAMSELAFRYQTPKARLSGSALGIWWQALTDYWFVFFGDEPSDATIKSVYDVAEDQLTPLRRALQAPVCFQKAYFWFNCLTESCDGALDTPERRLQFSLHSPRTFRDQETVHLLSETMRQCVGAKARPRVRSWKKLNVLFGLRTLRRRFTYQPQIIAQLGKYLTDRGHQFETSEHSQLPQAELIERYSRHDVLIALFGSAHCWQFYQPYGAIQAEWNDIPNRVSIVRGVDQNELYDYGGNAVAGLTHHVVLPNTQRSTFRTVTAASNGWDSAMPAEHLMALFDVSQCVIRTIQENSRRIFPIWKLTRACPFNRTWLRETYVEFQKDPDMSKLKTVMRYAALDLVGADKGTKLRSMSPFFLEPTLAKWLRTVRERKNGNATHILIFHLGGLGDTGGFLINGLSPTILRDTLMLSQYISTLLVSNAFVFTGHQGLLAEVQRRQENEAGAWKSLMSWSGFMKEFRSMNKARLCPLHYDYTDDTLRLHTTGSCNTFGPFDGIWFVQSHAHKSRFVKLKVPYIAALAQEMAFEQLYGHLVDEIRTKRQRLTNGDELRFWDKRTDTKMFLLMEKLPPSNHSNLPSDDSNNKQASPSASITQSRQESSMIDFLYKVKEIPFRKRRWRDVWLQRGVVAEGPTTEPATIEELGDHDLDIEKNR